MHAILATRAMTAYARLTPGLRQLRRRATTTTPEFDLAYVRPNPGTGHPPAVLIPGGPGLASVLPYRSLRRAARRRGLDVIMIEHRGVGLSRHDRNGRELPPSAMSITEVISDIEAVLSHEQVSRAHIVGSSYGSYLASSFAATHPHRVAGMLLDSALQSASHLDLERAVIRELLWDSPSESAALVRKLAAAGVPERELLDIARAAYELGGEPLLLPLLRRGSRRLTRTGSREHRANPSWRALNAYAGRDDTIPHIPCVYEFDLAGVIGFRELAYGAMPDGLPFDPALTYAPLAPQFPDFAGEAFDLHSAARNFDWPLVLLAGSRDLRTPPAIATGVAKVAPHATIVPLENGHSALDTHPLALLTALQWLVAGRSQELPGIAPRLNTLRRSGAAAQLPRALRFGLRIGL